jgi:hypothetical protein
MPISKLKKLFGVDSGKKAATPTASIVDTSNRIITMKVTRKLKYSDLAAAQKSAAETIKKLGKVKILVITEDFQGWESKGNWGDVSFSSQNDANIEKIAIVCEKQWEDLGQMFVAKDFRKVAIEFFAPDQLERARAWLKRDGQK